MRFIKVFGIALLGILIVIVGFFYDIWFGGIPYQEPLPEIETAYNFHLFIANLLYKTGGIVFLAGLIGIPVIWKMTQKRDDLL